MKKRIKIHSTPPLNIHTISMQYLFFSLFISPLELPIDQSSLWFWAAFQERAAIFYPIDDSFFKAVAMMLICSRRKKWNEKCWRNKLNFSMYLFGNSGDKLIAKLGIVFKLIVDGRNVKDVKFQNPSAYQNRHYFGIDYISHVQIFVYQKTAWQQQNLSYVQYNYTFLDAMIILSNNWFSL